MDDKQIREKLGEALKAPSPPQELVERTVERAKAITAGREAEKKLSLQEGGRADPHLAAQSVVGRLMMVRQPPNGASAEAMASQLEQNPDFRTAVDCPAKQLLEELQSGRVMQRFQPQSALQTPAPKSVPELKNPVVDMYIPVKEGPERT